ncbi:unnamed protein product [Heligmosomoides polygyrus]|uniref:IBB domain-containing protein n=1 Tax=Heligmosomoides polygyrus TaxID=6339 RepID=A0A183GVT0_HELPZ|nr:unnamed protein product [Heligmosomoides polygyrus]
MAPQSLSEQRRARRLTQQRERQMRRTAEHSLNAQETVPAANTRRRRSARILARSAEARVKDDLDVLRNNVNVGCGEELNFRWMLKKQFQFRIRRRRSAHNPANQTLAAEAPVQVIEEHRTRAPHLHSFRAVEQARLPPPSLSEERRARRLAQQRESRMRGRAALSLGARETGRAMNTNRRRSARILANEARLADARSQAIEEHRHRRSNTAPLSSLGLARDFTNRPSIHCLGQMDQAFLVAYKLQHVL